MNRADWKASAFTENKPANRESIIVCKENKSEYRYENTSQHEVAKIKIDGGLIGDATTTRCDYLLVDWDGHIAVFIELKGSDVYHAMDQIRLTIDHVSPFPQEFNSGKILARIVATKVRDSAPDIKNTSEYKKLTTRIVRNNGSSAKPLGKELILTHTGVFSETLTF